MPFYRIDFIRDCNDASNYNWNHIEAGFIYLSAVIGTGLFWIGRNKE